MLTEATFKNFKALADVRVPLRPRTCIVGANASGKTSVLEGIHCLARLAVPQEDERGYTFGRVGRIFGGRFEPQRIRTIGRTTPIDLGLKSDWYLRLTIVPEKDEPAQRFGGQVIHAGQTTGLNFERPGNTADFYGAVAATGIGRAVRLRLEPARLMEPSYTEAEVPRVDSDGGNLASVISYLLSARDPAVVAIEADLARLLPAAGSLRTRPAQVSRTEHEIIQINKQVVERSVERQFAGQRLELVGPGGKAVPADLLSEGTLLAIGLLTVLHTSPGLRLLLLDDIERAFHPRAQRTLVELLMAIQSSRPELQIICTTHSPFTLDLFDPEDILVMRRDAEGLAHCQKLTAHPRWPQWEKTLKAGEFWSFVGEDWV
jgi:predicted ATPase